MGILTYNDKTFLMDGQPYTIVSGAMHYFRIPREYWRDRLTKLKECGFNTVETYTCWNLHEKEEGVFDFSGMLDVAAYADEAASLGLNLILRPGPYICSEWEFGGLPAWLLKYGDMAIRCNDPLYLEKVRRYYRALFDELRPRLSTNGGNIIMVQIENEYGSYGNDKDYLNAVVDIYRECGVDVTLFTSDGACWWMLGGGTLPDYLCVANFGSHPKENFDMLEKFRPNQPKMCGEYWCGWFDHWYEDHHVREPEELAGLFRDMLEAGASLNFYMFHGGTNFGFMNGANHGGKYEPTITSYDYNALLSEAGDMTPAYYAVRKINEEFFGPLPPLTAKNSEKAAYGPVEMKEECFILDAAPEMADPVFSAAPKYQESIGQNWGFTLYSTVVKGPREEMVLRADEINDRAVVFMDGEWKGLFERSRRADRVTVELGRDESVKMDILLENMGRINYGPEMRDRKGMVGIRFGQQNHYGWAMTPLTMTPDQLEKIPFRAKDGVGVKKSSFLRGTLTVDGEPKDTFIRLDGFHHGFVAVNGFNLGRYYNDAGPQKTLYCPAPMLRSGDNEVIVFEMDSSDRNEILFTDTPDLG
ncbi:MAG: beta-galactosidase [Ruminococcaceae bacterium]|jgi:beta-galactosidase|nr:beta-galactosidase [Oscillospiraceae bacterium]